MPPSHGALKLHWSISSCVIHLWSQADKQTVTVKDINTSGWKADSGKLKVVCGASDHIASIQEKVALLTRGCGCKTGCRSKRCICAKKGQYCAPGCKCSQCRNIESSSSISDSEDHLQLEEEAEELTARNIFEKMMVIVEEGDSTICEESEPETTVHDERDGSSDSSTC